MDTPPLRGLLRTATVIAVLLTTVSGIFAATEAMALVGMDSAELASHPPSPLLGDPAIAVRALKTQAQALEGMRVGRTLALAGLALACAMASVSSARMFRPRGLPREAMRRVLVSSLTAAALLRTVEGAQAAAVARRVAAEVGQSLPALPEIQDPAVLEQVRASLPGLMVGFMAVHTAVIAGAFLILAQYYRSARAREQLGA